jgi:transcriptional regulator with XRE-family HTH domain
MIDKVVRDLRMKKDISSVGLSSMVGMNNTWVSQIETGKIKHPHLPALKKMLKILDVSDEEIEKIILDEFPDVDAPSRSHSPNKTDYRLERKLIRSKRKPNEYGSKTTESFNTGLLTDESFKIKCLEDANFLFDEMKKLPLLTVEILVNRLIDES